jgi:UDP-N-acetylglucosamine--dolichyl-phosphate N-acetylglucosaminephosphotransferase
MAANWYDYLIIAGIPFLVTFLVFPKQISFMKKIDWIGNDVHKLSRPAVAESGGITVLIGLVVGFCLLMIFLQQYLIMYLLCLISTACAAGVGFLDDKIRLSAFKKIFSVLIAAIPMTVAYLYGLIPGRPNLPFLGDIHIPLLYIPFIPGFLAVLMNVVNMYEGYNGQGSGTSLVTAIALVIAAIIEGSESALLAAIMVAACLLAFYYYNRFPAKVFPGDIGTLEIGMVLGCVAIFGHLEFVLIVAVIPQVFNAFHVIRRFGFKESKEFKGAKDIEVIEGDLIKASTSADAPLTVPRIIASRKPITEPQLVKNLVLVDAPPAAMAALSAILVKATSEGNFASLFVIVGLIVVVVICVLVFVTLPAIRGMTVAFALVYAAALFLLWFIENYVIGLGALNWLVAGFLALVGMGLWYILSMTYFKRVTIRRDGNATSDGKSSGPATDTGNGAEGSDADAITPTEEE